MPGIDGGGESRLDSQPTQTSSDAEGLPQGHPGANQTSERAQPRPLVSGRGGPDIGI